ncbi:MAG: STAS domain-containing protein [Planctomycetaceae bacterium]|nr:STAS domain-containing protein [Planctomycetaceae bacterium]
MTAPLNKVFCLERDENVLIVVPQGDASGFRYNDVHQESNVTLQVLDDPSLQHVVVDFKSEQILGSIIISVVIKVCRKAGAKGGKAVFCNASADMLEVLTTMNLTKLWPHHSSRAEAIASVRAG